MVVMRSIERKKSSTQMDTLCTQTPTVMTDLVSVQSSLLFLRILPKRADDVKGIPSCWSKCTVCVLGGRVFACGELRHVSSNPGASSVDGVGGSNLARSQKIGSICMCYAMRIHNLIACKENRG